VIDPEEDMHAIECPCGHHFEAADAYDVAAVA
jgi:hypothetical protein